MLKSTTSSNKKQQQQTTTPSTSTSNSSFEECLKRQTAIRAHQDDQLDRLYHSVVRVKNIATEMGRELNEQKETLEDIEIGVEKASFKLKQNNKKLDKLNGESSKSSSSSSLFSWLFW